MKRSNGHEKHIFFVWPVQQIVNVNNCCCSFGTFLYPHSTSWILQLFGSSTMSKVPLNAHIQTHFNEDKIISPAINHWRLSRYLRYFNLFGEGHYLANILWWVRLELITSESKWSKWMCRRWSNVRFSSFVARWNFHHERQHPSNSFNNNNNNLEID